MTNSEKVNENLKKRKKRTIRYNGKKIKSTIENGKVTLRLDSKGIHDITAIDGLEDYIDLQCLYLGDNRITEIIGLENLIDLEVLDLRANEITEIKGLERLTNLKVLNLRLNRINEIKNLENLTSLEDLYLDNNYIKEIKGISILKNLSNLHLNNNDLNKIQGLEKLHNLHGLYLNSNLIEKIEGLESLSGLEILNLDNNQIIELKGLNKLFKLQNLSLNYNKIAEIRGLDNLKKLKKICLNGNNIIASVNLGKLDSLQSVDINNNPLFEKIRTEILSRSYQIIEPRNVALYLKSLTEGKIEVLKPKSQDLGLQYNKITEISGRDNLQMTNTGPSKKILTNKQKLEVGALITEAGLLSISNKYEEALEKINQALKISPTGSSMIVKGEILVKLQRYKEGVSYFEKGLSLEPNHPMREETEKRIKLIKEYIKEKEKSSVPEVLDHLHEQGKKYVSKERFEDALRCYEEAIKLSPKESKIWVYQGYVLNKLKRHEEELKCYDIAIELDPNNVDSYISKGTTLNELEKFEEGIKCYEECLKIDPQNYNALLFKGISLESLEDYDRALTCYEGALKIKPNDESAYKRKTSLLEKKQLSSEERQAIKEAEKYYNIATKQSDNNKAIHYYNEALKCNPKFGLAWLMKGNSYQELGNTVKQFECYDEALKLEPENDEFWFMKGGALTIQKKYEEAIYCLDKALIFNPKNLSALLIKAEAYEKQEKFQEALDFIEKVLKIYPNNDMALYKKSIILKKKKGEKSKSPIKKESQNQKVASKNYFDGLKSLKDDRYEEAINLFDKTIKFNANHSKAWFNKAEALRKLGNKEEALKCYEEAKRSESKTSIDLEHPSDKDYLMEDIYNIKLQDIEIKPISKDDLIRSGKIFVKSGNCMGRGEYEIAIILLNKVLTINPKSFLAWINKSIALEKVGKHEDALYCMKIAQQLDSNAEEERRETIIRLEEIPHKVEMVQYLERRRHSVEEKKKALVDVMMAGLLVHGVSDNHEKNLTGALNDIKKNIHIIPEVPTCWVFGGEALTQLGRYEEAVAYYEIGLENIPNNVELEENKRKILKAIGITEEKYHLSEHLTLKAAAYKFIEEYEDSINCYDEILELNPKNYEVLGKKAEVFKLLGNEREADICLRKAYEYKNNRMKIQEFLKLRNFEAKTGHSTSSQKNIERNKRSAKEPLLDDSMWDLIKGILACVTVIITFVIIFSI